jgi:hypothetical protein
MPTVFEMVSGRAAGRPGVEVAELVAKRVVSGGGGMGWGWCVCVCVCVVCLCRWAGGRDGFKQPRWTGPGMDWGPRLRLSAHTLPAALEPHAASGVSEAARLTPSGPWAAAACLPAGGRPAGGGGRGGGARGRGRPLPQLRSDLPVRAAPRRSPPPHRSTRRAVGRPPIGGGPLGGPVEAQRLGCQRLFCVRRVERALHPPRPRLPACFLPPLPRSAGEFWIQCDVCDRWFDGQCVGMTAKLAEQQPQWKCPLCP